MKTIFKNQKGFTLIELLIALVIFAVGILGLATMQTTSIKGNSKGRQISEASNVAADQIEKIMSLDYDAPALDDDGNGSGANGVAGLDDVTTATADGNALSADGNYQIYWNIAPDHPMSGVKTINVIVDPTGNGSNVTMEVIKSELY